MRDGITPLSYPIHLNTRLRLQPERQKIDEIISTSANNEVFHGEETYLTLPRLAWSRAEDGRLDEYN